MILQPSQTVAIVIWSIVLVLSMLTITLAESGYGSYVIDFDIMIINFHDLVINIIVVVL